MATNQPLEYEQVTYNSNDGAQMGRTSQEKVAFFGAVPSAQRSNANQLLVSLSAAAGVQYTWQTQSQGLQAALTQGQVSAVAVSFSGGPQLSSADLLIVNKATPTPGFGICNARVSAANIQLTTCNITLHEVNASGATLNLSPDTLFVAAVRGGLVQQVTLSPSVVAGNNTSEQQFTVTGLAVNMVVPVTKPTDQQSLGIAGTRVVSNNTLGITFVNPGVSAVTPTASEVYQYAGLAGIASTINLMNVGIFVSSLFISGVSNDATTQQAVTVSGITVQDRIISVGQNHGTPQSGLTLISARVSTANTIGMGFLNSLSSIAAVAKLTPTANDTYVVTMMRSSSTPPMVMNNVLLTPSIVGVSTTNDQSFTVTGLSVSSVVFVSKPTFTSGIGIVGFRVSAANVLGITFVNPTNASITPPSETYQIATFMPVIGQGHYVEQYVSPLSVQSLQLSNELSTALAALGLIAGS